MRSIQSVFLFLVLVSSVFAFTVVNNCGELSTAGEFYEVSSDLSSAGGNCLRVTADDITLNLNGTTINGSTTNNRAAVFITGNNVTVENGSVADSFGGIALFQSENNTVRNVTAHRNQYGIYLKQTKYNTVRDNTAHNNTVEGVHIEDKSHNNTFISNTAYNNSGPGFYLEYSNGNNFDDNTGRNNTGNGFYFYNHNYTTFTNNWGYGNGNF
ncbi:right-handed parallel beta-helix repeat-containing protein, partial [Candidatus Micrarchaeota archaeon]|nr:right-handed parallel beta-helix repeat-containing protein [Candidatus Micrarchaeota archaeon]